MKVKNLKTMLLLVAITVVFVGCSKDDEPKIPVDDETKILIAYFSWTKNTKLMAMEIQEFIGGDLFEIIPVNPYPQNYAECLIVAKNEIDNNIKPPIVGDVMNFAQYDIIFIGTPNWYRTIPPPVATFLTKYNFENKIVIPFSTYNSGGQPQVYAALQKLVPHINIDKALSIQCKYVNNLPVPDGKSYNSQGKVEKWIKELGL